MTPAPGPTGQKLIKVEPKTLIWVEPLPDGGRAVVKVYRRRAFYDPLRRILVAYRTRREYELLAHLHRNDVPCVEPLWWSHGRDHRHGLHEMLATRQLDGAVALSDLLRAAPAAMPDLAPLFQLARCMHESGVSHGAFYPSNILVATPAHSPPSYHLIDLAHGRHFTGSIVGTRPAIFDLLDMLRAIERQAPLTGCERWIAGYGQNAEDTRQLLERFARHRIERPWRHIHRAETDARAIWHRFMHPAASRASPATAQSRPGTPPG